MGSLGTDLTAGRGLQPGRGGPNVWFIEGSGERSTFDVFDVGSR